ncbi:MAG: hypothetical protein ACI8XZ_002858 [Gammaproteobacteria bacterium]|jgi:hypothetical protein
MDDVDATLAAHLAFVDERGIRQILKSYPDPKSTYTATKLLQYPQFEPGYAGLVTFGLSYDVQ